MTKQKNLKEIINNHKWPEVEKKFLKLYSDQKRNILGYKKVFFALQKMKPAKPDVELKLDFCKDKDEEKPYVHVSGYKARARFKYWAIEFMPWNQWLGMNIESETEFSFSELEIISHALWEMTFCGYDEKKIQGEMKEIKRRADEALKEFKDKKICKGKSISKKKI